MLFWVSKYINECLKIMLCIMKISVIVPAYNEEERIPRLIDRVLRYGREALAEVIVADGQSNDATCTVADKAGARVLNSPRRGRAAQMNFGASFASGDILYFVHADTLPHPDFAMDIIHAIRQGYDMGCYRFVFDNGKWLLKINEWFTRLPFLWCRGGDQTLFVKKEIFDSLEGYRDDHLIMEDYEFIQRASKNACRFHIIPKNVIVSARKYDTNAYLRVLWANFTIMRMWRRAASQEAMIKRYKDMLNYR